MNDPTTASFTELLDAYVHTARHFEDWLKGEGEIPTDEELEDMNAAAHELNRRCPPPAKTQVLYKTDPFRNFILPVHTSIGNYFLFLSLFFSYLI